MTNSRYAHALNFPVLDLEITYRLAAHVADFAKGHPGAQYRDKSGDRDAQTNRNLGVKRHVGSAN